jgi:hypothetical protein
MERAAARRGPRSRTAPGQRESISSLGQGGIVDVHRRCSLTALLRRPGSAEDFRTDHQRQKLSAIFQACRDTACRAPIIFRIAETTSRPSSPWIIIISIRCGSFAGDTVTVGAILDRVIDAPSSEKLRQRLFLYGGHSPIEGQLHSRFNLRI